MKIQSIVMGILLIGNGPIAFAMDSAPSEPSQLPTTADYCKVIPKVTSSYRYTDFDFDSVEGLNFYSYQGHSNMYSVGADQIQIMPNLYAGVSVFNVNTSLSWDMSLDAGFPSFTDQRIRNNTLFAHILKAFSSQLFVDIAAGYGQNKVTSLSVLPTPAEIASSSYINDNWLASANAIYRQPWENFDFTANLGILYSEVNTDAYNVIEQTTGTGFLVDPLQTQVTMIMENAEVGYRYNDYVKPFVNAGLFQVIQYDNSRPVVDPANTSGVLPQLLLDENGYRLGAGLAFHYNNMNLRVEEKYYDAGGTFTSWTTLVGLDYQLG